MNNLSQHPRTGASKNASMAGERRSILIVASSGNDFPSKRKASKTNDLPSAS